MKRTRSLCVACLLSFFLLGGAGQTQQVLLAQTLPARPEHNQPLIPRPSGDDDPGTYTKPFPSHGNFVRPNVPFMQNPWDCSTRENQEHTERLAKPAMTASGTK